MSRPKGMSDEDWRARMREQSRQRRADPEKRAQMFARMSERAKERRAADPEFAERQRAYVRKYRAANREAVNESARNSKRKARATEEGKAKNAAQCRQYRNGPARNRVLAAKRSKHHAKRDENNAKRAAHYYEHREENRPVRAEKLRASREASRIPFLLHAAKGRAKKKGVPYDLDAAYLSVLWTGRCAITGIEFSAGKGMGPKFFSPSLDRINPALGYVRGNVRIILWAVNAMKYDGTDADVLRLALAIVENHKNLVITDA